MKRFIDDYLIKWKDQSERKPLLLRGARQVGKTYAVRNLGKQFDSFVELNLEFKPEYQDLFKADLDPHRIIRDIALLTGKKITPGKTLLFFDEAQIEPRSIQALRYFYEMIPDLHVVAAGSLLDFAIESVGMPVGRIESMYMYPMSFMEFLETLDKTVLIDALQKHNPHEPINEIAHNQLLKYLAEYLAIGGMPEIVKNYGDPDKCFRLQKNLLEAYKQDFGKYAKKYQIKYLDILMDTLPLQMGKKFKYSLIDGDYRKRELSPCLDLLTTAGVATKVTHTDAHGLPLGAQQDPGNFKVIFLDIALAQSLLGFNLVEWFLNPEEQFVNKGEVVEAFIGQELLAYSNPYQKQPLFYWERMKRGSEAEVDYVVQIEQNIVPIEVKSGPGSTLRSMHLFLESHASSSYGIRFSTQNYSIFNAIHSYPLYAVAQVIKRI